MTQALDPMLLAFWQKAIAENISVELPSRKAAFTLRFKLYDLRKKLGKSSDPSEKALFISTEAIALSVRAKGDEMGTWLLLAEPQNKAFRHALEAAGVRTETPMSASELLKDLTNDKT